MMGNKATKYLISDADAKFPFQDLNAACQVSGIKRFYRHLQSVSRYLPSIICLLLLSGCAAVSQKSAPVKFYPSDYICMESFCKEHNFNYSFDTIDDMVKIYSSGTEIKILLNSFVGLLDGSIFYFKKIPIYHKGKIFLPRQLEKIISSKKFISFKPFFTINTIVVDPGHGGKDPGAISPNGLQEKTVNLIVSKYLKKKLEKRGFKVILTRSTDTYLSLNERVNIAKRHNADLFISIHANANHSPKVNGIEIYYLPPSRLNSRGRSIKLAKNDWFQGKNIPFDAKAILWELLITKNYSFSVDLSNTIYSKLKSLGLKIKPPRKAPFYVLRFAYVPSVLFEMGYLSNYYEEKMLRKKHYRKQIAEAITLSILSFRNRYNTFTKYANAD